MVAIAAARPPRRCGAVSVPTAQRSLGESEVSEQPHLRLELSHLLLRHVRHLGRWNLAIEGRARGRDDLGPSAVQRRPKRAQA